MQKRGQVTLFIILGIVLIVIFGLVYYISGYKTTKTAKTQAQVAGNSDVKEIVKSYAENCIKKISEEVLFNKVGVQGGVLNPNTDISSLISPSTVMFDGYTVPYYYEVGCSSRCTDERTEPVDGPCPDDPDSVCIIGSEVHCYQYKCDCTEKEYLPDTSQDMEDIKRKLSNHLKNEFENCFQVNVFDSVGIKVTKQSTPTPNPDISINAEDISVKLTYPLIIKKGDAESKLESFIIILPIRLKALYDSSKDFMNQIKGKVNELSNMRFNTRDTPPPCTIQYDIIPHCQNTPKYNKNRLTNVYNKNAASNTKVIQFVDFSTYLQKYFKSFVFQFAIRGVNIDGACTG